MRYLMKLNKLSPKSKLNNSDVIPSKYKLTKVMEEVSRDGRERDPHQKVVEEYLNDESLTQNMPAIKNSRSKLEPLQQS